MSKQHRKKGPQEPKTPAPHALDLPEAERSDLSDGMRTYFERCDERLGFVPNVLRSYSFDPAKLESFVAFYNDLMMADSPLSKLEREMIAVAVSSENRCYYCLTAHGAAVRQLSGDAQFGEQLVMNFRSAALTDSHRAMLEFAVQMTQAPETVEEADRQALRDAGFSDRAVWDIAAVAAFFNMTNRLATAVDMRPNPEYHGQGR